MNFFEHQDQARRKTGELVVLFAIAVILIVAAVNAATFGILKITGGYDKYRHAAGTEWHEPDYGYSPLPIFLTVTGVTLLIILGGSAYKTAALSKGGPTVAQMLGGRLVTSDATDARDRMLQNVVEEMSIASGVPVPRIYVMDDEQGINAFAAGFTTDDAVIGVTRGCLEQLNRDELQGVVAHEYSHILNGDMRLNLRLIGTLHGILLIALIGLMIMRGFAFSPRGRMGGRGNDRGGGGFILVMIAAAVAMIAIGYIGVFFGRLIQAAVSRQREFLADSSAVQFTRNPMGLVGALKKIGQYSAGSKVENAHALETAHLFFGNAVRAGFTSLLATHPPLEQRIRAIDPTFDGHFEIGEGSTQVLDETGPARRGEMLAGMLAGAASAQRIPLPPRSVAERAGHVMPPHIVYAAELVGAIPGELSAAARDPFSARAVVLALLAGPEDAVRERQLSMVRPNVEPALFQDLTRLLEPVGRLGEGARLPMLDLALPALLRMSPPQMARFLSIMKAMIEADGRVTLFEFALFRIVEKQLRPADRTREEPAQFYSVRAVREEATVMLSALAGASTTQPEAAFEIGARTLDPDNPPAKVAVSGLRPIDEALKKLARCSPPVKKRLIDAFAEVVAADGEVNVAEAELLRATAATLDVPIPPILAGSVLSNSPGVPGEKVGLPGAAPPLS